MNQNGFIRGNECAVFRFSPNLRQVVGCRERYQGNPRGCQPKVDFVWNQDGEIALVFPLSGAHCNVSVVAEIAVAGLEQAISKCGKAA